jgi:hypothetical protein
LGLDERRIAQVNEERPKKPVGQEHDGGTEGYVGIIEVHLIKVFNHKCTNAHLIKFKYLKSLESIELSRSYSQQNII